MTVGEYIKMLRTSKSVTQEDLGKIIGVQRAAVQKWESGKTQNLKRATIQKLANYFDVPASSFIIDNDIEQNEKPIISEDDELKAELNKAISKLTTEQKSLILAQIKGILSDEE